MAEKDQIEKFLQLYNKHHKMLYGFIANLIHNINDVDDILQDTMKTIWQKFDEYDSSRKFSTWACTFAYNEVRNYRHKLSTKKKYFSDQLVESISRLQMSQVKDENRMENLSNCISKLKSNDKKLIEKRYSFHGSMKELASNENVTPNSLYKSLQRIRKTLLLCLKSCGGKNA